MGWRMAASSRRWYIFFFNDTATTEIYTLSLHDALPISVSFAIAGSARRSLASPKSRTTARSPAGSPITRSEEHTSELQSQSNLVCRLLLEKKKIDHALFCDIHINISSTTHNTRPPLLQQ